MPFVIHNGVKLYYEDSGTGSAVVFINGIWQDTASWTAAVRDMEGGFRCITYDCRGQGQSDKPADGPYAPELHASDLLALLDELGVERSHLVGLSNGGIIALHFARLWPERVGKLVLADTFTHLDGVQQAMFRSWRVALADGGGKARFFVGLPWVWSPRSLETKLDDIVAMLPKAERLPVVSSYHLIDGALTHDARGWLRDIHTPALVINGELDLMVPHYRADELRAALPDARLVVIEGGAHAAWLEQPAAFNAAIIEFLSEAAAETPPPTKAGEA